MDATLALNAEPAGAGRLARWRRALAAVMTVAGLGLAVGALQHAPGWIARPPRPLPALGHAAAARAQQGQPTTAAEAEALLDRQLAAARAAAAKPGAGWMDRAAVGDLLLSRARLTGSFADYRDAGPAFADAFRVAPPGTGPHLSRAAWAMAVHRLAAVAPDLDAVDRYRLPDDGARAGVMGLRGDLAFYTGRYAEARRWYERAQALLPSPAGAVRLANWEARLGDPDRALALLDEAQARVSGPQQQLLGFIEARRGAVELGRGRWAEAEAHLARADDIFPGAWTTEEPLATVRALRGRPDAAMAIFRRMAARGVPDGADGMAGLFRAEGELGDAQLWAARAGAAWDARLRLLPEAALGHALDHLLAFGDPARALAAARANYRLRPYGDSATGLAAALLARHDARGALGVLQPQLDAGWRVAEAHLIAADAHALLGEGRAADAERDAALAIDPHAADRNPGMTWLEQ